MNKFNTLVEQYMYSKDSVRTTYLDRIQDIVSQTPDKDKRDEKLIQLIRQAYKNEELRYVVYVLTDDVKNREVKDLMLDFIKKNYLEKF
jgi:uncharacterized protein YydD (DUF2326 family)